MFAHRHLPAVVVRAAADADSRKPALADRDAAARTRRGGILDEGRRRRVRRERNSPASETALSQEKGTWGELFSGRLRLPLVIGIPLAILQQVTGINVFMYFGATIFKTMSASTGVDAGLLQQIIINGAGVLFTLIAIATVDKWGRKPLMLIGATGMGVSLLAMGVHGPDSWPTRPPPAAGCSSSSSSTSPASACRSARSTWVILSEIFPTAVRGRALGPGDVLPVDGRLRRDPDLPDDGRQGLVVRAAVQPRLPVLRLCRLLRRAGGGGVALVPETKGRIAGGNRSNVASAGREVRA